MNRSSDSRIRSRDRISRRQLLRQGSTWLLGGSGVLLSARAIPDECDRLEAQGSKRCSDNDTGEGSDPTGCGRCMQDPDVPARRRLSSEHSS